MQNYFRSLLLKKKKMYLDTHKGNVACTYSLHKVEKYIFMTLRLFVGAL